MIALSDRPQVGDSAELQVTQFDSRLLTGRRMSKKPQRHRTEERSEPAPEAEGEADPFGLERLVFFSDAVFAIAITLLSIELRLPETDASLTNSELWQAILSIWPKYLAFVISFLVIGGLWIGHHRRFRHIKRYDRRLVFLNLLLLMAVAFVPFPTSLISDYGNRTATVFYAMVMILINAISATTWWYASRHDRLIDPQLSQSERRRQMLVPLLIGGVFALSIGLAFIDDDLAKYSWILAAFVIPLTRRL